MPISQAEWTPEAENDLEEILLHLVLEKQSPLIADRMATEISQACDSYSESFAKGHVLGTAQPNFGKGYRIFRVKAWIIIFRPIDHGIEVMRIFHGSQDYPRLFR